MTEVYFVRHAEPDNNIKEDSIRPLTEKGLKDRLLVTDYLQSRKIEHIYSSPYQRAVDTIKDYADKNSMKIICIDDFRERKIDSVWIDDFKTFSINQWKDFAYKLNDGESLKEVQDRNIKALNGLLDKHKNQRIAIGSHGAALSTIINYYDSSFGYEQFESIIKLMPWIVKFTFKEYECLNIEMIDLFE